MRQIVVSTTTVGTSAAIPLDTYIAPCNVSIGIAMDSGSEVAVEHTFSDVLNSAVTPTWYPTFSSASDEGYLLQEDGFAILQQNDDYILTGNENVSYFINFPVSALRLITNANTGTVTMTVLQVGRPD